MSSDDQRPLALVTGAGGAIGLGVADLLQSRGFRIIAADLTEEAAGQAADVLGSATIRVACDARNPESVRHLADRIRDEWAEDLEVLVCNAGLIVPAPVALSDPALTQDQLQIMLNAPAELIGAAAASMVPRERGAILATVSVGGVLALPGSAAYSAAKAGLRAYLAALSAELTGTGVHVGGIYPSGVDTPMLRQEALEGGSALNFVGRVFDVDDVVRTYAKALDTKRLETYVSHSDGVFSRLLAFAPAVGHRVLPLLEQVGERGRRRYIAGLQD